MTTLKAHNTHKHVYKIHRQRLWQRPAATKLAALQSICQIFGFSGISFKIEFFYIKSPFGRRSCMDTSPICILYLGLPGICLYKSPANHRTVAPPSWRNSPVIRVTFRKTYSWKSKINNANRTCVHATASAKWRLYVKQLDFKGDPRKPKILHPSLVYKPGDRG